MATEQKESDKKNKKGPKSGAKAGNKADVTENKEKQVQNKSEAAETKPKAAHKSKKGSKKGATVAEEPTLKKKGRPARKKPVKGDTKQTESAEQQPAKKPAAKAGRKEKPDTKEITTPENPVSEAEHTAAPDKAPQAGRVKKKRGSGKKRGNQKPVEPEKAEGPLQGQPPANSGREKQKEEAHASETAVAENPQQPAAETGGDPPGGAPPAKEAPRKKKGRPKKTGKKKEVSPPPLVVEKPIVVQENKVVIASRNPAKIKAVEMAFGRLFPEQKYIFENVSVPVGVSEQPMSDDETFAGALFRAQVAREESKDAGFYIGLEGGIEEIGDELQAFGWMVVLSHDHKIGKARTSTFVLPYAVAELIRDGKELGEADDLVFGKTNSKLDQGAVGILTHGLIDRAQFYAEALIMALIPFKNPEFYSTESLETV